MRGSSQGPSSALLPTLLLLLLTLSAIAPAVQAQELPEVGGQEFYKAQLTPDRGSVYVEYLGNALVEVTVEDVSSTSTAGDAQQSRILLDARVEGRPQGWLASVSSTQLISTPGDSQEVIVNIQAGATINDPEVNVIVEATYISPSGQRNISNLTILAVAQPKEFINLQLDGLPDRFQPDEQQALTMTVRNDNYYPDMISFEVSGPDGWVISPPSSITLGPGEERTIRIDAKAPQNPWFLLNSKSELILVTARSSSNPAAAYTAGVPASMTGFNVPAWVVPHIFLFLIGAVAMIRSTRRRREEKALEKGRPEYPGIPIEDEARLAALKKKDPDKASVMEDRLHEVHRKRKEAWKARYQKRKEIEEKLAEREKARHDALLAAQKEKEKEEEARRRAEEKRRKKEKKAREKKLKRLRKKKAKAKKRAEKARQQEEKRLRKEMEQKAKDKEQRLKELRERKAKLEQDRQADGEQTKQAKAKKLEELKKRKAELEKADGGDDDRT